MSDHGWPLAALTLALLGIYQGWLLLRQRRAPNRIAPAAHANMRADWFSTVTAQAGSEVLAVQTLRNALMSATLLTSTAAFGLMGSAAMAVPALHAGFGDSVHFPELTPRLLMELLLLSLLFASLASSVMAVRYYNHVTFIVGIPVGTEARARWDEAGAVYIRRAGLLYAWSLRQLLMVAPTLAFLLHPWAGVASAVFTVAVLIPFDRATDHADEEDHP